MHMPALREGKIINETKKIDNLKATQGIRDCLFF